MTSAGGLVWGGMGSVQFATAILVDVGKTLNAKLFVLVCAMAAASPAWADGKLLIPRSANVEGAYLSTQLLLEPCMSDRALAAITDDPSARKDAEAARKALPPGTCDDPALVEKLFKARFLEYATLDVVNDPWNFHKTIAAQDKAIDACKDTHCLDHALDAVIGALSPVYLRAHPRWPSGKGLCTADAVDTSVTSVMARLGSAAHKAIASECGDEAMTARSCNGSHGRMLFVSCAMEGNQVNAPQWLYHADKENGGLQPMLTVEDGPVGVMESTCNGMPDLLTSARESMAEHEMTYYRYDGKQYRSVYAFTAMGIGADDNGNDLEIAVDGKPDARVVCR